MNILHVLSQNQLTGAEVYATQLIEQQLQKSHMVFQASNGFFHPTLATQVPLTVETKSKFEFWKNVRFLRRFIQEKNIHVIHTHSRAAAKLVYWARKGLKVGYVSTIHGRQHSSFSKRLMNHYGDFQISVCENIQEHLIKDFGYNPRRLKVVRNPISTESFYFQKTGVDANKLKIALIGRTTGPKGLRTKQIFEALPKCLSELQLQAELFLVGGSVKDLKLNHSHTLTITELNPKKLQGSDYANYDLVIGSGRVAMESLLTGIPTISFGEAEYAGLTRLQNLSEHLHSNFGDIGASVVPALPVEKFKADLQSLQTLSDLEREKLSSALAKQLGTKKISRRIERIYESSYFLANYSKWIPVLMYHKIPKVEISSQHKIFVTEENFRQHLEFFKSEGFETLTFTDLKKFKSAEKPFSEFPKKPLILTFDDGYRDNYEVAAPLLRSYDFKAQLFLLADQSINHNYWDTLENTQEPRSEILAGTDRKLWIDSPFSLGSHGFRHQRLPQMNEHEARHELADSKTHLEAEFKIDIPVYAYTYGDTNPQCAEWAFEEGYDYAVNTDAGGLLLEEDPYSIFRVNIFPQETRSTLKKKTSSWYRRYYYFKRKK